VGRFPGSRFRLGGGRPIRIRLDLVRWLGPRPDCVPLCGLNRRKNHSFLKGNFGKIVCFDDKSRASVTKGRRPGQKFGFPPPPPSGKGSQLALVIIRNRYRAKHGSRHRGGLTINQPGLDETNRAGSRLNKLPRPQKENCPEEKGKKLSQLRETAKAAKVEDLQP